ncbi:type II toxin-antitoxin system prevent-host-death family antitoxin [Methylobacterium sp. WL103]|uniref:type II toxin-antitoxin system Phd/YefM family antitoxin n=1 Tax=unclassified Methylobacterium TaxID=2615210 RepID=UPI0011CB6498|nr:MULTISPECIES: type II toxin-antitoxin system prevent-host-death family antitoxin [unclassified Methylobacterium]TXM73102.1 type II toxin-antitoxin system prevent-host-death family antitoxin [Methylobacterium sp. WL12]TXN06824.1 type II toxin-antitoxin system prevent-host-death family antitoxin [Methylobacterium sp. WL103]
MAQVGLTELRRNFAAYLDQVENDRSELVVTRQNHEPLVILPLAELDQLRETLHLLGTPANAKRLLEAAAQIEAGGGSEHDLIEG